VRFSLIILIKNRKIMSFYEKTEMPTPKIYYKMGKPTPLLADCKKGVFKTLSKVKIGSEMKVNILRVVILPETVLFHNPEKYPTAPQKTDYANLFFTDEWGEVYEMLVKRASATAISCLETDIRKKASQVKAIDDFWVTIKMKEEKSDKYGDYFSVEFVQGNELSDVEKSRNKAFFKESQFMFSARTLKEIVRVEYANEFAATSTTDETNSLLAKVLVYKGYVKRDDFLRLKSMTAQGLLEATNELE
jgi:hypothetical protein